jgi:hypothetical protein
VQFRRALLTLALVLITVSLAPGADAPPAELPVYSVGDQWTLSDATYRLDRIQKDAYVYVAEGNREIWLGRDLGVRYVRRGSESFEVDPPPGLSWPLTVGRRGGRITFARFRGNEIGEVEVQSSWRVMDYEDVEVAGRKVGAFRVFYQLDPEIPGRFRDNPYQRYGTLARSAKLDYTVWYSPEARRIVKLQSSRAVLNFEMPGTPTTTAQAPVAAPPRSEPARPAAPRTEPSPPKVATPAPPAPGPAPLPPVVAAPAAPVTPPAPAAPLAISVRYPADGARVKDEQTVVAAVVTSGRGVGSVTISLNGLEVMQQAEKTPQPSVVVTAPVTLREGSNTIVLTAREADGTVRQEVRTVTLDRERTAAAPAAPPPAAREAWAVIIGVGRYENPKIPTLRYAVADAEAMYKVLTASGFKKDHVLLLTDTAERKPTLRNIKYALGTFLARSAGKDDTVIVYFAGHGAPEVDPRGVEKDGLAKYLIPSDADPDDLFSTALPMDDLQTIFDRIEAERVVAFLDSCYSGAAGGRTFAAKKTRAVNVDDLFLERLTRSKGRVIITAARPSEVSIELADLGHGVFTYYLTEGLKGAGDLNKDGIVSLQELYEYVQQQVVQKSRAVGGNQHPLLKGEMEGVLPLTKARGR